MRNLWEEKLVLLCMAATAAVGQQQQGVVPFTPPKDGGEYRIDPKFSDFKRKRVGGVPHIWVKWLGWPSKFNQWVPEEDIRHLLPEQNESRD